MACAYSDLPYHRNGSCSQCETTIRRSSNGQRIVSAGERAYWWLTLARLHLGPLCEADLEIVNTGENCPTCRSVFHYDLGRGRRECTECGMAYNGPGGFIRFSNSFQEEPSSHRFDCIDEINLSRRAFNCGRAWADEGEEE